MKVLYAADLRECSSKDLMCRVSEKNGDEVNENISFDDFVLSLTPAKKRFALSLIELYKRDKVNSDAISKITCANDIYRLMYPHLYGVKVEEFWAIFMTNAAKPIKVQRFTIGGLTSTLVDTRVVLREALLCQATCMAVCHVHPSGSTRPSIDDDNITMKIKQVCEVCNVRLIDHLIFAGDNYYSYSDEAILR